MSQTTYQTSEQERVQAALNKLSEFFSQSENIPKFLAKSYLKGYGKPSDNWSLNNQMIMLAYGFEDARTFNKWKSVERFVNKGQKGFYIIAPNMITVKAINKEGQEETRRFMKGFKICPYAMFGLEQTSGKAVKYVEQPKKLPPLYEVAQRMGIKVSYGKSKDGEYGAYNQHDESIRLCTEDASIFFHELAHAAHKRIDGKLKGGQDVEQETIAELCAAVLAEVYGYDNTAYSYHYLNQYDGRAGENIAKVIGKVQKVLDYIFEVKRGIEE